MCGIICILANCDSNTNLNTELETYKPNIMRRGPNSFDSKSFKTDNYNLVFAASVLWLQGRNLVKQPLGNDKSILVYNGDIFGGKTITDNDREVIGDTILFRNELESLGEPDNNNKLSDLQGPYAFIYLNKTTSKLYFGRDIYGRRSLLIGAKPPDNLILTSVASGDRTSLIELPSIGVFSYDLKTKSFELYPWNAENFDHNRLNELKTFLNIDISVKIDFTASRKNFNPPSIPTDLIPFEIVRNLKKSEIFNYLLTNSDWLNRLICLKNLLEISVKKRVSIQQTNCRSCSTNPRNDSCSHSLVGVLFSGGVDCTILSFLAHKFIDRNRSIDLINVAFDNKVENYQTPDRISALESLEELKRLCPDRRWNFIEVNVTKEELNSQRTRHIRSLIYPLNTILDDSLGCALWFAGRGLNEQQSSTAHILLVGMGADELFGGYSKHRLAFKNNEWQGLDEILNEDWSNLPYRNLGRDDRVVSDNGRQLRTPYLGENVAMFVKNLNAWEKTFLSNDIPQGIGDKILLRSLAYYLGLENVATFKKRALQFGSRIANSREKAHEISTNLIK